MKQLAYRIFLFSLPLLLLWAYAEVQLGSFPNSYLLKQNLVKEKASGCKTIILGSSLAYKGIFADSMENAINLANVSQDLYYDSALLATNFNAFHELRNVIITVSYFSLTDDIQAQGEIWRKHFYRKFNDIEPREQEFSLKDHSLLFLYTPLEAAKMLLRNNRNEMVAQISPMGSYMALGTEAGKLSDWSAKNRVMVHDAFKNDPRLLQRNTAILKNLIRFLVARNIHVILLNPPAHASYRKFADPAVICRNREIVNSLCQEYSISYLDCFEEPGFMDEDFNDADHLNINGALKLTRKLNQFLAQNH
jgi:hypothetical protein